MYIYGTVVHNFLIESFHKLERHSYWVPFFSGSLQLFEMRYFIRGALFRFRIHFPFVLLLRIIIFDIFFYDMFHGWVFFVKWYISIQRPNFGNVVYSFQSLVVYFLDNFHHWTDSKPRYSISIIFQLKPCIHGLHKSLKCSNIHIHPFRNTNKTFAVSAAWYSVVCGSSNR